VALEFKSDGTGVDGLGSLDLGQDTINVNAAINNYASAAFGETSGPGVLSRSGNSYTLDLGTIAQGIGPVAVDLDVLNSATGPSDLLAGSFAISGGSAFTNSGFSGFSGLSAGQIDATPTVALDTSNLGTFSESVRRLHEGLQSFLSMRRIEAR
jgi:hypothetical protein